jgi:hypothetical protein
MALDPTLAPKINLGAGQATEDGFTKSDIYEDTIAAIEQQLREDAAIENPRNQEQRKNREKARAALKHLVDVEEPKINRSFIKTPVIAINYAATPVNFATAFRSLLSKQRARFPESTTAYLGRLGRNALNRVAPDTMAMQDWATDTIAAVIARTEAAGEPPRSRWTVGSNATFATSRTKETEALIRFRASPAPKFDTIEAEGRQIETRRDERGNPVILATDGGAHVTERVPVQADEIDKNRTARSIYSQIIQGFDASVLHEAVRIYDEATGGAFITTNHDAFTVPQEYEAVAAGAIRRAMHKVMSEAGNVPQRIYDDAVRNLEMVGLTPEEVGITPPPARGTYDLDDVLTSTPVFAEDPSREDAVPVYADIPDDIVFPPDEVKPVRPELARAVDVARYMEDYNPAKDTLRKITRKVKEEPGAAFTKPFEVLERQLTNSLQPIRELEKQLRGDGTIATGMDSAFKAAEMALNDSGRNETLLYYGAGAFGPNGEFTVAPNTASLREIFKVASGGRVNGQQLQHWFEYMVARRAQDLKAKGIKTPLLDADITAALARERPEFKAAAKMWRAHNNANLQMLKDSGRITEAQRKAMADDALYIPFYRTDQLVDDGTSPEFTLPAFQQTAGGALRARDPGIKAIKGGDKTRIANVAQTMIRNSQAMVAAAVRNQAFNKSADLLKQTGMAREVRATVNKPTPDSVKVFRDGKEYWLVPEDPDALPVIEALGSMQPIEVGGIARAMNTVSALFRQAVTLDPGFMLNNLWRGMVSNGILTGGSNLTLSGNTFSGFTKTLADGYGLATSQSVQEFKRISGMGDYRLGQAATGISGNDILYDFGLKSGIGKVGRYVRHVTRALETTGMAFELADRVGVYDTLVARGVRKDEAAYTALSTMNYARRGAAPTLRKYISTMPFMNARLQGYSRLLEGTVGPRATPQTRWNALKKLALYGFIYTGINAAAWAYNNETEEQVERYQDLPTWRRVMFLNIVPRNPNIPIITLPQPFELGFIFGAIPTAWMDEVFRDLTGAAKEIGLHVVKDTMAWNFIPQAAQPIIEQIANYQFFFKRPIVARREVDMRPIAQTTGATAFERFIAGPEGVLADLGVQSVSPARMKHIGDNYGGILYSLIAGTFNTAAPGLLGIPDEPSVWAGDNAPARFAKQSLRGFVFDDTMTRNKWSELYYEAGREAAARVKTTRELMDPQYLDGEAGSAEALRLFESAQRGDVADLRRRQREIESSQTMSPQEKRRELQKITKMLNTTMEQVTREMNALMGIEP